MYTTVSGIYASYLYYQIRINILKSSSTQQDSSTNFFFLFEKRKFFM